MCYFTSFNQDDRLQIQNTENEKNTDNGPYFGFVVDQVATV